MNIIAKARKLETIIARTFNDAARRVAPPGSREPLEIVHAILEVVEDEVQPAGRGAHVFPFNHLEISVLAPSPAARARLESVFNESPTLHDRILERLRGADCDVANLIAPIAYVAEPAAGWITPQFHIDFVRAAEVRPVEIVRPKPQRIGLATVCGTADAPSYSFVQTRIDLGRCVEVRDNRNRLIRTNHVAFVDDGGAANQSVSRCHAHVEYDDTTGSYRLCDDRSAHGTGVLRNGRTLIVAPGSRGVRLHSDDEIVLGEARLRVTVDPDAPE